MLKFSSLLSCCLSPGALPDSRHNIFQYLQLQLNKFWPRGDTSFSSTSLLAASLCNLVAVVETTLGHRDVPWYYAWNGVQHRNPSMDLNFSDHIPGNSSSWWFLERVQNLCQLSDWRCPEWDGLRSGPNSHRHFELGVKKFHSAVWRKHLPVCFPSVFTCISATLQK